MSVGEVAQSQDLGLMQPPRRWRTGGAWESGIHTPNRNDISILLDSAPPLIEPGRCRTLRSWSYFLLRCCREVYRLDPGKT